MKERIAVKSACFGLGVLIVLAMQVLPLHGQFKKEEDADAKMLVITSCTPCHGPSDLRERVSKRAGKDVTFWTGLVWKMNTSWDAQIPEKDIAPIANFFAKYGDCTVCHEPSKARGKPVAEKKSL